METTKHQYPIFDHQIDLVAGWFSQRGGVVMWRSQLIGEPIPDTLTPKLSQEGTPMGPPGWRFTGATPIEMTPDDIIIVEKKLFKAGGTRRTNDKHCAGAEKVPGSMGCFIDYGVEVKGRFYNTVYYAMIRKTSLAEHLASKAAAVPQEG